MYMEEHGQNTPLIDKWSLEFMQKRETGAPDLAWSSLRSPLKYPPEFSLASYGQIVHQSLSPLGTASGELGRTV